ncbi:MAG: DUF1549 and DUF1553 domain-containing protein [Planctomycetaceae bacterium]
MTLWLVLATVIGADAQPGKTTAHDLARQIDRRIDAVLEAEQVVPAEPAGDTEFLRRLSLDLIGRIPTADEISNFLGAPHPDRRAAEIDRLLCSPEHARHFARVWRALLLPEADSDGQVGYFVPGFEAWLERSRLENTGFDKMVRELLTVAIAAPNETPQFVLREMRQPNPLAFIAAKNAEPAKIASSSVRLFLGLRLECAQCHDHPFDRWTREQFWSQAAFFAGIERRGKGTFAPLVEDSRKKSLPVMETGAEVSARYLDGSEPLSSADRSARGQFAEWISAPENPFFARAIANRVWSQLMGRGLVEPVDDIRESNPASHPELLDDLAQALRASRFDVGLLLRAVCLSQTYQRSSRQTDGSQARPELFARRHVKPLSGEQFFDSLAQAIGHDQGDDGRENNEEDDLVRRRVLRLFDGSETTGDPETSVAQALALMNGSVVARAVVPDTGPRLREILAQVPESRQGQFERLYLNTLSRLPTAEERRVADEHLAGAPENARDARLGDLFWALLNSAEFRWNH